MRATADAVDGVVIGHKRSSTVVGLTIEPGRIAAAQVSVNGSIVIEDGGRAELESGVVRDGEVADSAALSQALRALWAEHRSLDKKVRIGVANSRIVVRTMYLPPISDATELAIAVRFNAADLIPMPLADAVLDFQSVGVVQTPEGPRERIVLVAARRDMIGEVLNAVRGAGLKPAGIDLSAFGMVRALQRQRREDDGAELFVAIGGLTNLAIAEHGVCAFTRVAGHGLESLAAELAERMELTLEHARMWLHQVGLEVAVEDLPGDAKIVAEARAVLQGGARRIATEIRTSLDFQQGQAEVEGSVQRVVLTGPAVAIAGFAPALAEELELEVSERVVAGTKTMNLTTLDAGCLSVAAGLAVERGPAPSKP